MVRSRRPVERIIISAKHDERVHVSKGQHL